MRIFETLLMLGIFLLIAHSVSANELSLEQKLGMKLYQDINLSLNRNQSCETCHTLEPLKVPTTNTAGKVRLTKQPSASFVDPTNVQTGIAVSAGSNPHTFGSLNAPSTAYAAFSPPFHWDGELFIGGQFWNGRANNLVAQAKGPLLNPTEMAMPSEWSVIQRLKEDRQYHQLFKKAYNIDIKQISLGAPEVQATFHSVALAIAAFERSSTFNRFNSKFDYEAAGLTSYTPAEQRGADLFDDAAKCGECHTTEGIQGENSPALLTDYSYDNLGLPSNPFIPNTPSADTGLQGNPNLEAARGEETPANEVMGRHKVRSLRNIELTSPYMHNGLFKTLEEVVHFYNTRDKLARCESPANATNPSFAITCWPQAEFHNSHNIDELGDLGLTTQDEADIVSYLKTFTDSYPEWGNRNGLHDVNITKGTPSPYKDYPVPNILTLK